MNSYVSANTFPLKLLHQPQTEEIQPLHIQLIPTNKCNANCSFCSCSKVDRTIEMPYQEIEDLLHYFCTLGTQAVTITGGGEPTLHPNINDILLTCKQLNLSTGLVTNGHKWAKQTPPAADTLTWVRYSITHLYTKDNAQNFLHNLPTVDVGFSFTVTETTSLPQALEVLQLAETNKNVTHVRFVQNITDPNEQSSFLMEQIKSAGTKISNKGIYQLRNNYTKGNPKCLISKLKPLIDATGYVYPCCGVQYAIPEDTNRLPELFKMCHWKDFHTTTHFNGSPCKKCYYENYNNLLNLMQEPLTHKEFI